MPYGGERALNGAIAHLADVRGCCVFESLFRDVSGGLFTQVSDLDFEVEFIA